MVVMSIAAVVVVGCVVSNGGQGGLAAMTLVMMDGGNGDVSS